MMIIDGGCGSDGGGFDGGDNGGGLLVLDGSGFGGPGLVPSMSLQRGGLGS